jgi:hypothetical protein
MARSERERCLEALTYTWQCPGCRCLRPESLTGLCEACWNHQAWILRYERMLKLQGRGKYRGRDDAA